MVNQFISGIFNALIQFTDIILIISFTGSTLESVLIHFCNNHAIFQASQISNLFELADQSVHRVTFIQYSNIFFIGAIHEPSFKLLNGQ
jgi:hypothetical protein